MTNETEILKEIIEKNGETNQHMIACEECSELIKAVVKFERAKTAKDKLIARNHIVEECADVSVVIDQLKLIHDISEKELQREKDFKLVRLKARMDDGIY